jgi:enediyne biosynthesis protein E3
MVEVARDVSPAGAAGWRLRLALHPSMVDFERRGFRLAPAATRATLEAAGGAFLSGFNTELATAADEATDLSGIPAHLRGFAAEGAAMAAVLLDRLNPFRGRRFVTLRRVHEAGYAYLLYVGAGWAMTKLRRRRLGSIGADEPLLRWLAYDGMGFSQAFFATERGMRRWSAHPARCARTCDIRYQGLGRSLWFRECGDVAALAARIAQLPPQHHDDVWSGVALAATYAGGIEPGDYAELRRLAGDHAAAAGQGAAFGAEAWRRCGHAPAHAHTAVEALAGVPLDRAAAWTWQARQGLDRPDANASDYRQWRLRVQQEVAATTYG